MKETWRGQGSILWIGDSTARRAAATLYGILNSTTANIPVDAIDSLPVLNVNKKILSEGCDRSWNHEHDKAAYRPSFCRSMPGNQEKDFIYLNLACWKSLEDFLLQEQEENSTVTRQADVIIIAMGLWETVRHFDCFDAHRTHEQRLDDAVKAAAKLLTNKTVIWRTAGFYHEENDTQNNVFIQSMNDLLVHHLATVLYSDNSRHMVVDWGGAVKPRSFGKERIVGDVKAHYGLEARMALLQMITNLLAERGVF
jgi:hypothetical protein